MNQAISSPSSSSAELVGTGRRSRGVAGSRMLYSRLIGALFLAGFVSYGVGFALVTSVTGAPDFLSTISAHQTTLVLGAFLMLLNSGVECGQGGSVLPDPGAPRQANRASLPGRDDCRGGLSGPRCPRAVDDRSLE